MGHSVRILLELNILNMSHYDIELLIILKLIILYKGHSGTDYFKHVFFLWKCVNLELIILNLVHFGTHHFEIDYSRHVSL